MYDDEQCLESVATSTALAGSVPPGGSGGVIDDDGCDTADDVSQEELDGADPETDLLCNEESLVGVNGRREWLGT